MGYLTAEQRAVVTQAVAEAELTTSGEIVTVLADRSDGFSDVVLVYAVTAAFAAMSAFALFPATLLDLWNALTRSWGAQWTTGQLASLTIALGLVAFTLAWLILSIDAIRFALLPAPIKTARVHEAAIKHFKVGAERRTHGRTGVLLYLSMREHRAEIVADEPIAVKVPPEVWGEAMADMLVEIRKGAIAEGLAAGVRDVGGVLAEHFPRGEDDQNELPDRLIEL